MNIDIQVWLFAGGFTVIGIVGAALLHHMLHCKGNTEAISDMKEDIKTHINPEISKLRERTHDQQNSILRIDGRIAVLEERTK